MKLSIGVVKKIIKYGTFGALTAGLEFTVFIMLLPIIHIYAASTVSFLVGLIASFVFNKFVVFKNSTTTTKGEIAQFVVLGLVNSQVSSLVTLGLSFLLPSYLAKIVTIMFIAIWNFVVMNFVIFRKKHQQAQ